MRVRFKLCKTQAVAEPSASVARGASLLLVPLPDAVSPGSGAERRYELYAKERRYARIGDESIGRAWIPRRDTEGQPCEQ